MEVSTQCVTLRENRSKYTNMLLYVKRELSTQIQNIES